MFALLPFRRALTTRRASPSLPRRRLSVSAQAGPASGAAAAPDSALAAVEAARDAAVAALEAARQEHAAELAMLTAEMNSVLGERYEAKEALRQLSAQANAGAAGQAAGPLAPTAAGELERTRTRVRELEGALKQAVRDYQALLREVVVLRGAVRDAKEVARQHEVRHCPEREGGARQAMKCLSQS